MSKAWYSSARHEQWPRDLVVYEIKTGCKKLPLVLVRLDISRPYVHFVDETRRCMGQVELHRLRKIAYVSEKKLSAEVATRMHLEET